MKNTEEKIKYYCAFSYLFINPLFKAKLFEYFDYDIKRAFQSDKKDLDRIKECYNISIPKDFLSKKGSLNIEQCYREAFLDKEVKIITYEDNLYPQLLKQIPDFPLSLYYKGNLDNIDYNFNLSIVGSRKASNTARIALDGLISDFKNSNITIVSGLAYGIDTQAHKSAIENNLKTIAVVGSGLDIIYPKQNKDLFDKIKEDSGAILSEYPLKTKPLAQNFPQRNRIVVGLSKGVLVAEAQIKSGAMISANLTLDYNRELMCIPGNILNPNTQGIYYLIKNGAGIVTNSKDLLNQMDWDIILNKEENRQLNLSDFQKKILDIISVEPKTFDEIILTAKADIAKTMVTLTELELKNLIKQHSNKYYKI